MRFERVAVPGLGLRLQRCVMRWFLIPFVVVPLLEVYLLLWVSRAVGFWPTVALTLVTGLVGGTLAKREGRRVLRQWTQLSNPSPQQVGLVDAGLVLVGGVLLITPGVLTDLLGFALLIGPIRQRIGAVVRQQLLTRLSKHAQFVVVDGRSPDAASVPARQVIDTSGESAP
jgi:UPF0716 protein FxsA